MRKILLLLPLLNFLNSSNINKFTCDNNTCQTTKIKNEFFTIDKLSITGKTNIKLKDLHSIYKLENISNIKEFRADNIVIFKKNIEPTLNISNIFIKSDIQDIHNKYILNGNLFVHFKGIKYIHNYLNEDIFLDDKKKFINASINKILYSADISTEEEIDFLTPFITNTVFHMLDGLFSMDIKVNFKEILNNEEITYDIQFRSYNNMYLDAKIILKIPNYGYEIFKSEPKLDLIVKRIKIKGFTSFGKLNKEVNKDELYSFLIDKYKYYYINLLEEKIKEKTFFKKHSQEKDLTLSIMENIFNMFSDSHFINIDYINTDDVNINTFMNEILF
jgi:hypothetical protein